MSKLIPMACLALLGTAGPAWADQASTAADPKSVPTSKAEPATKIRQVTVSSPLLQSAATAAHTYTAFDIRYEMKL